MPPALLNNPPATLTPKYRGNQKTPPGTFTAVERNHAKHRGLTNANGHHPPDRRSFSTRRGGVADDRNHGQRYRDRETKGHVRRLRAAWARANSATRESTLAHAQRGERKRESVQACVRESSRRKSHVARERRQSISSHCGVCASTG